MISDLWKTLECEITIDPEGRVSIAFGDTGLWITLNEDGTAIEQEWIDGAGIITEKPVNLRARLIELVEDANHD